MSEELDMPVAEYSESAAATRNDLLEKVDRATTEANATVESDGPGLLKLGGLIVREILNPAKDSSTTTGRRGE